MCMGGITGVHLLMEKLLFTHLITFYLHNRASLLAFRSALGCFESFLVNIVMEFINNVLLYLFILSRIKSVLLSGKGRIPLVSSVCCLQHLSHHDPVPPHHLPLNCLLAEQWEFVLPVIVCDVADHRLLSHTKLMTNWKKWVRLFRLHLKVDTAGVVVANPPPPISQTASFCCLLRNITSKIF